MLRRVVAGSFPLKSEGVGLKMLFESHLGIKELAVSLPSILTLKDSSVERQDFSNVRGC